MTEFDTKWERISLQEHEPGHNDTWRLKVPGGWIYRCDRFQVEPHVPGVLAVSMVFVPEPDSRGVRVRRRKT